MVWNLFSLLKKRLLAHLSSAAFSDINNDGHEDVLITGANAFDVRIAALYINDGNGNFTEMQGNLFDGVWLSSVAFSDVNGDDFEDVLFTGNNIGNVPTATLYINDGSGNFTQMMNTPFDGVSSSSVAFADVNGDDTNDVIISGQDDNRQEIAKLYTNDGSGNFTEMMNTPFEGVWASSVIFTDIDNNDTQDVLITGRNSANSQTARLYTNDGDGNFTEVQGTPFIGVWSSSLAISDTDGDGDDDILISGQNNIGDPITFLYNNEGSGNFIRSFIFEETWAGAATFADINGDGSEDLLITGRNSTAVSYTHLTLPTICSV